jgi:UDP-3-O-[3-hydroxymyristoyl] glucosamine N-acyltransferase
MGLKLRDLAALLGGELVGDGECVIERVASIEHAGAGEITFVSNSKYTGFLQTTQAAAIIVAPAFRNVRKNLIVTQNPYLAFARAVGALMEKRPPRVPGVHPTAIVAPTARLGTDVSIGPRVVIEDGAEIGNGVTIMAGVFIGPNASVGDGTWIHPNATLYYGVRIGKRCIIHANVSIGSDGFGWAPLDVKKHYLLEMVASGRAPATAAGAPANLDLKSPYERIPQVGITVIGDDVSIGAGSVINRGGLGNTSVGRGTKIDSCVVISHNVEVGEDCLFVSQVGVSGTVKIGNHCSFGGQVGVAGHLKIGDNVGIYAQSGVSHDLPSNGIYFGSPARPMQETKRTLAALHKLPELRDEIRHVQKRMSEITALLDRDVGEAKTNAAEASLALPNATDADLAALKDRQDLRELNLQGSKVTDGGLAHLKVMKGLQTVILSRTQITDAGLAHLKEMQGLASVNLEGTQVTAAGLADLKAALPNTRIGAPAA